MDDKELLNTIRDNKVQFIRSATHEELRKFVDDALGVDGEGGNRTEFEVGQDINYGNWVNATYEVRRRYLRQMCFAVWNGKDGKSQSSQIFEWIKKLLESKATVSDVNELDGGNRKALRKNNSRKNKIRRNKTRRNKTRRNKTRRSKTRRNKTRRNKTRKNKRRYSKTRKNKRR